MGVMRFLNRWIYTLFYYIALPFMVLRLKLKAQSNPGYGKRIHERFGMYPKVKIEKRGDRMIWFHTVSVGESIGAAPLIHAVLKAHPDWQVVITCMTPTGSEQIKKMFRHDLGERVHHVYCPYDYGGALHRFFSTFKPDALAIMETELWPNMLHFAKKYNVPAMLMNARLSEKSAKGYAKVSTITRELINNLALVACQYEADAERFKRLGVGPNKLHQTGSLKFDIALNPTWQKTADEWKAQWHLENKKVFIAASTHENEEELLIDAFASSLASDNTVLIIVPRHPERFETAYTLAADKDLRVARKTDMPQSEIDVLIGNTMGEMMVYLSMADACFVGGSLIERGGHNPLEPAVVGCAVSTGPHTFNFATVYEMMEAQGALCRAQTAEDVVKWFRLNWVEQSGGASPQVKAASEFIGKNQGALASTQQLLESLVEAE